VATEPADTWKSLATTSITSRTERFATVTVASFCAPSECGNPNCFYLYISLQHVLICLFENKGSRMTATEEGTSRTCRWEPEDCRIFTVRIVKETRPRRRWKDDFEPRTRYTVVMRQHYSRGPSPESTSWDAISELRALRPLPVKYCMKGHRSRHDLDDLPCSKFRR
jgi:hypothetical protein